MRKRLPQKVVRERETGERGGEEPEDDLYIEI